MEEATTLEKRLLQGAAPAEEVPVAVGEEAGADGAMPDLQLNWFSGLFCFLGSLYNHENIFSRKWLVVLLLAGALSIGSAVYVFAQISELSSFHSQLEGVSERLWPSKDAYVEEAATLYTSTVVELDSNRTVFTGLFAVVSALLSLTYVFVFRRSARVNRSRGPTLAGRCLFPVETAYYHEENKVNRKVCFAILFGSLYTLLCYTPTYQETCKRAFKTKPSPPSLVV